MLTVTDIIVQHRLRSQRFCRQLLQKSIPISATPLNKYVGQQLKIWQRRKIVDWIVTNTIKHVPENRPTTNNISYKNMPCFKTPSNRENVPWWRIVSSFRLISISYTWRQVVRGIQVWSSWETHWMITISPFIFCQIQSYNKTYVRYSTTTMKKPLHCSIILLPKILEKVKNIDNWTKSV